MEIKVLNIKDAVSKKDVLNKISIKAKACDITSDSKKLEDAFIAREEQFSTGFEDGFAIPHARIKEIKKPAIIVAKLGKKVDWKSLDGKPTAIAIALCVPLDKNASNNHMAILAKISQELLNEDFRNNLKSMNKIKDIEKIFNNIFKKTKTVKVENKKDQKKDNKGLVIVGASACPTGVAHTYMVAKALENEAKRRGHTIYIEKHGAAGLEDAVTEDQINKANVAILALGKDVPTEKFGPLPQHHVEITKAIKNISKVMDEIEEVAADAKAQGRSHSKVNFGNKQKAFGYDKKILEAKSKGEKFKWGFFKEMQRMKKSIFTGLSWIIPLIAGAGILMAIGEMIFVATHTQSGVINNTGKDIDYGGIIGIVKPGKSFGPWTGISYKWFIKNFTDVDFGHTIYALGRFGLAFFLIPILGGFIGYGLAGKPGFAPALIIGFLGGTAMNGSFIGALVGGLLGGYLTLLCLKLFNFKNKTLVTLNSFLITPLVAMGIGGIIYRYSIGMGIQYIMNSILESLKVLNSSNAKYVIAGLLGAMVCFDFGGPINKTGVLFALGLLSSDDAALGDAKYYPLTYLYTAISVPMLTMFIVWIFNRKHFNEAGKSGAITNGILSIFNISENVIPFAISAPLIIVPTMVLGGATSSIIVAATGAVFKTPFGVFLSAPFLMAAQKWKNVGFVFMSYFIGVAVSTVTLTGSIRLKQFINAKKGKKFEPIFFKGSSNIFNM